MYLGALFSRLNNQIWKKKTLFKIRLLKNETLKHNENFFREGGHRFLKSP